MSDSPSHLSALNEAIRLHLAGDFETAEASYRNIIAADPAHPDSLHLLGVLHHQQGRHEIAEGFIHDAIRCRPGRADYHNNLGVVLRALGRLQAAAASYREAIRLDPDYPDALANLGVALHEMGDVAAAREPFDRALASDRDHVDALYGLGNLMTSLGRHEAAVELYERARSRAPHRVDVLNNLGGALAAARRTEAALEVFRGALALEPAAATGWSNAGATLESLGRLGEAADAFAAAARLQPERQDWPIRIASLCPVIFPDSNAIERYRVGLEAVLDAHRGGIVVPPDPARALCPPPPFLLPHHGYCDRAIKEKFARLYRDNFPGPALSPGDGPIRVGFFANSPHHGGFLRVIGGIVEGIDPGRFRAIVIGDAPAMPAMRDAIRRPGIEFLTVPGDLPGAAAAIAAARCDVLYHWQVGTDPFNYFLAHHRLAPVQCTSWGSHVTTGVPTIDYFLSSDWIEPDDADGHYSETLVRLPTFPTFEPRPPRPDPPAARDEFGLPERGALYMCLQRLAKFHPDFDPMLGGILRRDPAGLVVALEDEAGHATADLRARLRSTIPDVADRVVFLPRSPHRAYLRLLSLADVVLDTPYFGCGHTGYDALGLGLPIVTWPGRYKVGRYVLAYYRRLGILDLIAETPTAYVDLAVRLGTDRGFREELAGRLTGQVATLYWDDEVVREYEKFFIKSIPVWQFLDEAAI